VLKDVCDHFTGVLGGSRFGDALVDGAEGGSDGYIVFACHSFSISTRFEQCSM
jgi:hypothetical protein